MAERLKCPCGRTHGEPTLPRQCPPVTLHDPGREAERWGPADQAHVYAQWLHLNGRRGARVDRVIFDEQMLRREREGRSLDISDRWYAD